jgi:hypothetical protein
MKCTKFTITAAAVLLAASALPVAAANVDVQETAAVTGGWQDPAMPNVAASWGRAMLRHLRTARSSLASNNLPIARGELRNCAEFATAIKMIMPYVVVTDQVENAKHQLVERSTEVFYANLLPIYGSLDELEVYAPKVAAKARAGVKQAEQQTKSGNKQAAAKALQDVADEISKTTIYLPIQFVSDQIRAAQTALGKNKPDVTTAQKAVDNALSSLTSVVDRLVITPDKS